MSLQLPNEKQVIYVGQDTSLIEDLQHLSRHEAYVFEAVDTDVASVAELVSSWYRLLVLDIDTSTVRGLLFLQKIQQEHAGIPVIVVANPAQMTLTQVANAHQNGAECLLFKPFDDIGELAAVLRQLFERLDNWKKVLAVYRTRGATHNS